ncbi:hypothetical protein K0M31_009768 [Melipona bicolor]|uniref:Uncharacterized protein n=1 Tax=Melipona bicolor TaxID=60889 RepID=A0AA40FMI0_9HYME|nr:hypothetical protein K0M31_009768 [Melipona bicolor]
MDAVGEGSPIGGCGGGGGGGGGGGSGGDGDGDGDGASEKPTFGSNGTNKEVDRWIELEAEKTEREREGGEWEKRSEGINKVKRKRARHGGGQGRQQLLPGSRPAGSAPFLPGGRSPARSSLLPFPWVWSGRSRSDSRQSVTGRRTGTTLTGFPDAPRRCCLFPTRSRIFFSAGRRAAEHDCQNTWSPLLLEPMSLKFRTDLDRRWY